MTAQVHERLILDGVETSMAFCPPLPEGHERLREQEDDAFYHTACWRGYEGTWEIKDGRFYLVGVEGRFALEGSEPLLADWFSGTLRVPRGEILHYVHMGFGTVFEEEIHIQIDEGVILQSTVLDNRGKRVDSRALGWQNLPGFENRFDGDGGPLVSKSAFVQLLRSIFRRGDERPG